MKIQSDPRFTGWRVKWAIILGWYDGVTDGICRFEHDDEAVWFSLVDERFRPDDVDDRLFALSRLPGGSGADVTEALAFLGPSAPIWSPTWMPDGSPSWHHAEEIVARLEARRGPVFAILHGDDLTAIRAGWWVDDLDDVDDMFVALGLAEVTPATDDDDAAGGDGD